MLFHAMKTLQNAKHWVFTTYFERLDFGSKILFESQPAREPVNQFDLWDIFGLMKVNKTRAHGKRLVVLSFTSDYLFAILD